MTRNAASAVLVLAAVAVAPGCRHQDNGDTRATDGRAGLVFTRYTTAEQSSVWIADADGSNARRIATDVHNVRVSPDGRRLAYVVPADEALPSLFIRDVAGGDARRVGQALDYAWSPDGTRLAVVGPRSLFLFDVTARKRRTLVPGRVFGGFSFAPNGDEIAYSLWNGRVGRRYRSDIFRMRLSDARVTRLTDDGHSDDPVWGRRWIVYRRFHFSNEWSIGRLRLVRPDGSGDRMLARGDERTSLAHMGLRPLELSEDGKRLLACAAAEFHCAPVTLSVPAGTTYKLAIRSVVRAGELAHAGDLSADGSDLLFTVGPFDGAVGGRVYVIPFEGGKPRLLVRNASEAKWRSM